MASEKQQQVSAVDVSDYRPSPLHARRRKTIIALGGIAILATGIASGIGLSTFCNDALEGVLHSFSSPMTPTSPDSPVSHFHPRSKSLSHIETRTDRAKAPKRPNKFFGPTNLSDGLDTRSHLNSDEKRESSAIAGPMKAVVDSIETVTNYVKPRQSLEKRDTWEPEPGLTWNMQLSTAISASQLKKASKFDVWDLDLFDTPASSIDTIHQAGSKVICYMSAGTSEDWRTDFSNFTAADIGTAMGDWAGESWLNTNSQNVRKIMMARLDLAKSKGCDGIDPDNMDAYNHDTGFSLTQKDAINYITFLSQQASQRGLAMGLKNSGDIIPQVVNLVQYSVEESCNMFDECAIYKPFTDAGKPVFHVEYPKGYGVVDNKSVSKDTMDSICTCIPQWNFSPIVKNNNLDTWQQKCP